MNNQDQHKAKKISQEAISSKDVEHIKEQASKKSPKGAKENKRKQKQRAGDKDQQIQGSPEHETRNSAKDGKQLKMKTEQKIN